MPPRPSTAIHSTPEGCAVDLLRIMIDLAVGRIAALEARLREVTQEAVVLRGRTLNTDEADHVLREWRGALAGQIRQW